MERKLLLENVYNWPLLYTLGAPRKTLEQFHFFWNGHVNQYSRLKMLYREFIPAFDWEHNGENYAGLNLLPLAPAFGAGTTDLIGVSHYHIRKGFFAKPENVRRGRSCLLLSSNS